VPKQKSMWKHLKISSPKSKHTMPAITSNRTVDFRTAYDYVDYKIQGSEKEDNGIWTNKLILGMASQTCR